MKITKSQLKQIIKEELEKVLNETPVDLAALAAAISACLAKDPWGKGMECGPIAVSLGIAVADKKYIKALTLAGELQTCVGPECASLVQQVLGILQGLQRQT